MIFQDRLDILLEMKLSGVAEQGYAMLYGKSQINPFYQEIVMKKLLQVLIPILCVPFLCSVVFASKPKEFHVLGITEINDVIIDANYKTAKLKMKFDIFKEENLKAVDDPNKIIGKAETFIARIMITQTTPTYSIGTIINRLDGSKPPKNNISKGMLCKKTTEETLKTEKKAYKYQKKALKRQRKLTGIKAKSGTKEFSDWEGKNINDLITEWGAPSQVIDNGTEGKIMIWRKERSYYAGVFTGFAIIKKTGCYTFWVNPQNIIYQSSSTEQ